MHIELIPWNGRAHGKGDGFADKCQVGKEVVAGIFLFYGESSGLSGYQKTFPDCIVTEKGCSANSECCSTGAQPEYDRAGVHHEIAALGSFYPLPQSRKRPSLQKCFLQQVILLLGKPLVDESQVVDAERGVRTQHWA